MVGVHIEDIIIPHTWPTYFAIKYHRWPNLIACIITVLICKKRSISIISHCPRYMWMKKDVNISAYSKYLCNWMNICVISSKLIRNNAMHIFIIALNISFTANICCYMILSYCYIAPHTCLYILHLKWDHVTENNLLMALYGTVCV